jgi:anti-sigma factor RsiW
MSREHLPVELLSAHLDGETTPGERGRVELHLAACAACRAELEDLRRIVDASSRLVVPEVPVGLRDRIAAAVARPRARRRAWIGAAASLATVGLVATAWYLQGPQPVAEPPAPPTQPKGIQAWERISTS